MTDATAAPTWLGPIRQTAFVVDDIEAAAMQWVTIHGVGPWFLYHVDIPGTTYRGTTVPMRARMGLAQSGIQQIELIQPDLEHASLYKEFVDAGGQGVHHLCYWADIDRSLEHFTGAGAEAVQFGETGNGNRFLYTSGSCGVPYVEFVDPNEAMAAFFSTVAHAAVDWDGTNPLRGS